MCPVTRTQARSRASGCLWYRGLTGYRFGNGNYQAARCVREGVPRDEALRAVTLHPARLLGLESEIGSLEVGKVANVVVFSGDPLAFDSWVQKVSFRGEGEGLRLRTIGPGSPARGSGAGSVAISAGTERGGTRCGPGAPGPVALPSPACRPLFPASAPR